MSITAVSVLQALANGYEYGFDVIDQTGLPSGTVYPALSRLERDGLVRSAWEDDAAAHAEGRPARRYYSVTAPGVRALAEAAAFYRALLPARPRDQQNREVDPLRRQLCDRWLRLVAPVVPHDVRREWRAEIAFVAARSSQTGRGFPLGARASGLNRGISLESHRPLTVW